ncbi:nuclear transport factor 2 family protein [Actinomadura fulvescens]|uniref:SnoaL-like domain-containing protein n=1 Tax=Actinomadura fulvescens TaxID=46160 RepID=A0ABN3QF39_9ACTN
MNVPELIQKYIDTWNERDDARRAELLEAALTEDAVYSDPDHAGLNGRGELSAAIGKAQAQFGDLAFAVDNLVNVHHDKALFRWRLGPVGADSAVATGYDYVEFADGRIRRVIGFFE